MIFLDTDIYTLYHKGHPRVCQRVAQAEEEVVIAIATVIEVLQGRFAFVLKAADGAQLRRAMALLQTSQQELAERDAVPIDAQTGAEFDKLRQIKKLKKIRRGDMLIASAALAHHARLISRNMRDFALVPGLQVEDWSR